MSDIKKCDRCGAAYKPGAKTRIVFEWFSSGIGRAKYGGDLCEKCTMKFHKWWNKPKGGAKVVG